EDDDEGTLAGVFPDKLGLHGWAPGRGINSKRARTLRVFGSVRRGRPRRQYHNFLPPSGAGFGLGSFAADVLAFSLSGRHGCFCVVQRGPGRQTPQPALGVDGACSRPPLRPLLKREGTLQPTPTSLPFWLEQRRRLRVSALLQDASNDELCHCDISFV